jgi:hypothetical protein
MEPKGTDLTSLAGCKAALQESFWGILQDAHRPRHNKYNGTKDKVGDMYGTHRKLAGELQVYVAHYWKENCTAQIYRDANDRGCDETNKERAMKDRAQNGLMYKNRNREECEFNDNKENTPIAHLENAPFPDIPAEAPGILTEREET